MVASSLRIFRFRIINNRPSERIVDCIRNVKSNLTPIIIAAYNYFIILISDQR